MIPDAKTDQIKSIELCSEIIERMASNSFKLKAWFLVSFSALFTFMAKNRTRVSEDMVWVLPLFFFAGLDAYYLRLERIFRLVYEDFQKQFNGDIVNRKLFDFEPSQDQWKEFTILHCLFSPSIEWFYFPLITTYWLFIGFHTLDEGWHKWPTMLFLPLLSVIGMMFCRKCYQSKSRLKSNAKT